MVAQGVYSDREHPYGVGRREFGGYLGNVGSTDSAIEAGTDLLAPAERHPVLGIILGAVLAKRLG